MLFDLGRDCRHACRALLRTPALTGAIILTLGLGIGANVIIFSAVDAVLLRDVPVGDPERVVDVFTSSGSNSYGNSSYPDFFDLRDSGSLESLAAYAHISLVLDTNGQAMPLPGEIVSGNYFDVLGVRLAVGRAFAPEEDRIERPVRVAIVSHALWQRTLGASASLVGQSIRLNGNAYTVIGVAPRGFTGPVLGVATEVWVPTALQPEVDPPAAAVRRARGHSRKFDLRGSRGLSMVGRLPADGTLVQAASRATVVAQRLQTAYPDTNRTRGFTLARLGEGRGLRVSTRPVLGQLSIAVGMVLLIACVNVASLLLTRAAARTRDVAVRVAIGASRARLIRQWFVESVLLALLGSIAALVIAWWGTPLLHTFVVPDAVDLSVNPRILAFTLLIAVGSGLLFGLAPVLHTLRRDTMATLREEGATVATGAAAARTHGAFVIVQVALTAVLLVGAGLFLRTLAKAYAVDLGYQVDRTLIASLDLDARGYSSEAGLAAYQRILSQVQAIPGVIAAGAARMTVLTGGARSTVVSTDGRAIQQDGSNALGVRANVVSDRYLDAMTMPIVRGRPFGSWDGPAAPRVAIATQSLVDRLWPGEDPIGKTLHSEGGQVQAVVGVVPDTVYTSAVERDAPPTFYVPLAQNYEPGVALHVRTSGDPRLLLPAIREAVRQVDSRLTLDRPQRLREVLDRSLSRQRMMATLVGLFGAVTLLLAATGLYGLMAHTTAQRTAEIGIRLALGGQRAAILGLVLTRGLGLLGVGLAIGLAGALSTARYVEAQLFGVTPGDPLTFAGVCIVLTIAGLTACAVPARRAMHIDPIITLRRR